MNNDPAMMVFMVSLLVLLVGLFVWYFTAEHYEELLRNQTKHHQQLIERNQQLEAERRELDKGLSRLDQRIEQYADVLEGESPELEVTL